jgi:hypothetical protein
MKRKPNFDQYLEEQLKDVVFAERFKKAGEAWDIAVELAALRNESGLSKALKEIIVGPAADKEKASQFARECIREFNTTHTKLTYSGIPYRV